MAAEGVRTTAMRVHGATGKTAMRTVVATGTADSAEVRKRVVTAATGTWGSVATGIGNPILAPETVMGEADIGEMVAAALVRMSGGGTGGQTTNAMMEVTAIETMTVMMTEVIAEMVVGIGKETTTMTMISCQAAQAARLQMLPQCLMTSSHQRSSLQMIGVRLHPQLLRQLRVRMPLPLSLPLPLLSLYRHPQQLQQTTFWIWTRSASDRPQHLPIRVLRLSRPTQLDHLQHRRWFLELRRTHSTEDSMRQTRSQQVRRARRRHPLRPKPWVVPLPRQRLQRATSQR